MPLRLINFCAEVFSPCYSLFNSFVLFHTLRHKASVELCRRNEEAGHIMFAGLIGRPQNASRILRDPGTYRTFDFPGHAAGDFVHCTGKAARANSSRGMRRKLRWVHVVGNRQWSLAKELGIHYGHTTHYAGSGDVQSVSQQAWDRPL
uniref:Uncharacterized protein n=1 Tax=Trypanosoma congolense (strain IL3000) TaxID=1068625 RepID=G0V1K4_TRYCI|nr:hypothetical protein, unlikely [Trypanosoma congolense IL3000]